MQFLTGSMHGILESKSQILRKTYRLVAKVLTLFSNQIFRKHVFFVQTAMKVASITEKYNLLSCVFFYFAMIDLYLNEPPIKKSILLFIFASLWIPFQLSIESNKQYVN